MQVGELMCVSVCANMHVRVCLNAYVCVCVHMHEYVTSWEEKVHTVSGENLCLIDLAQYYIPSTRQVLGT